MKDPIRIYRKDFNGQLVSRVALYKISGGYSLMIFGELGQSFTERDKAFAAFEIERDKQIAKRKAELAMLATA